MSLRRMISAVIVWCLVQPPCVSADETNDKLDTILKELRVLSQRVSRLEARVEQLARQRFGNESEQPADALRKQLRVVPLELPQLPTTADEVIRLQNTAPEALMNEIHERERILRKRFFPPEIMPSPPFPIHQP